ncbi:ATP-binding protein [Kordiimonas sp.]|uniref:ATP-binding protein n=1 Tax=Kordiimonas sp. TaxID=1970157 RepID=UPI003A951F4A
MQQLPTIVAVITGYYLFLAVAHWVFLPADIRGTLMGLALVTAFVSGVTYVVARRGGISASVSHYAFVPAGLLGVANVFTHVALTGEIIQMTNAVLALMVFGFVTLRPLIYFLLTSISVALYIFCLMDLGGELAGHFAFFLLPAFLLGLLCFGQRYRTLTRIERMRLDDREKSEQLEVMNASVTQQMKQAKRAAEEARRANEAKGIFLANTSHELRTPLTGVLGMMNLLERTKLDSQQRELVEAAQVSAKTLLTLINDILDLAKLDEGKLELKNEAFDVVETVRRLVDLLMPAAAEKGLQLNLHVPDEAGLRLVGDPVRIGQILLNLVGNAVKFTEEGRVDVTVTLTAADSALYRMSVLVEDTGIGFDEAAGAKLFRRFEQVDGSERRRQSGTGLGLAICRELTDLMDGIIDADSMPGVGSRFRFAVTLPKAEGRYDNTPRERVDSARLGALKLRVLLAEDNRINQMLVEKLLARYGWDLVIVSNGQEAVNMLGDAAAGGHGFDLVLMDVRMPVMDGKTAAKAIRAMKGSAASVPIIALTANTMPEDIEAYRAIGMDDVVAKPIDIDQLESAVDRLFPAE